MTADPPRKRQRLGAELRGLREAHGWSLAEAAKRLGYTSPATVSKLEHGTQRVTRQQVPNILEVYNVTDARQREHLRALVHALDEPDWWQKQSFDGVVDEPLSDYLSEIESATSLFVFNPVVLHGLLQIPEYTRAITEASGAWESPEEIDQFVAMRIAHQQATFDRDPPLKFHAVLTEGQLRQQVGGPKVHRAQLQHLAELASTYPGVTLQVLPFHAGAHAAMDGPFMLLGFAFGRDLVRLESMRASLRINDPDHVELYRATSELLKSDADPADQTAHTLTALAQEVK